MFLLFAAFALSGAAFAQATFSSLDLSPQDRLLFKTTARSPDFGSYDTLFLADIASRSMRQLTFFPEEILLLQQKDVIQIQNRYGVFRSEADFKSISPIPLFPSFVTGSQIQGGKIAPMQTSPDGRYLLYLQPRSAAYGELKLLDVSKSEEVVVSDRVELSLRELPAVWSSDSAFIVYCKDSMLHYFSLAQLREGRILTENLRKIGAGRIANVRWGRDGTLHYLSGTVMYAIDPNQLFTRALYDGFLTIGRIEGKIPFVFDPNFDSFWMAPDGRRLLLSKGGRNIFLYNLRTEDFHDSGDPAFLPYLYLPRDTVVQKVVWSGANVMTILCQSLHGGKKSSVVFRLSPGTDGNLSRFQRMPDEGIFDLALSPGEGLVALVREGDVSWKDYASWKDAGRAVHPDPLHVLWLSDEELLIAGAWFTQRYSISTGETVLLALSQATKSGYAREGNVILAQVSEKAFVLDEKTGVWGPIPSFEPKEAGLVSDSYRVYVEPSTRGIYQNMIMVRDAKGFGTVSLVPAESVAYEAFPADDQPVDFSNFTHGSRIRRREVGLVFNAVDSPEGLTGILHTLSAFRLRCTFFVNGEFIRRYPDAVHEIAQSGHEIGSLFSSYFNMTDARFKIDTDFVKAGLARNEDDYHAASGRELSLLWHAPYYLVNSDIIAAGRSMNYLYVGRDLDTYDWASESTANLGMGIYSPAAALVNKIIAEKKPGSIIPILVGPPAEGGRKDYLFQSLDLIVNELEKLGYRIVPVSTLIEHAR